MPRRRQPRTPEGIAGRCPRCWVPLTHCVCAHVRVLRTDVDVVVVRHEREVLRSSNTVRIASLALPDLTIVNYGDDPSLADQALKALRPEDGTYLVYPGEPRSQWPAVTPRRLLFLDGTWAQTRRMARKLTALSAVPRLWLPEAAMGSALRLRQTETIGGRSTIEAMAEALALVGETGVAAALTELAMRHVHHVLRSRGRWVGDGDVAC